MPVYADLIDVDVLESDEGVQTKPARQGHVTQENKMQPSIRPQRPKVVPTPAEKQPTATATAAEKSNPNQPRKSPSKSRKKQRLPVKFEGETMIGQQQEGVLDLDEKVWIRQGEMEIKADHAKLFFEDITREVEHVEARGNVKLLNRDEERGEYVRAFGDKVTYSAKSEKAVLMGNATLYRGADIVRGDRIDYDLKTGIFKATRVKGVVKPETKVNAQPSE